MIEKRLIITAASESFAPSLLALLGSLNLNWPDHPPVLVYDIGLSESTLNRLAEESIKVEKVPAFCEHWRKHFTWKAWCWQHAPAEQFLYVDSGVVFLQPVPEAFLCIDKFDYFVMATNWSLETNSSEAACAACGVTIEFCKDKPTVNAGIVGLSKSSPKMLDAIAEIYNAALHESAIKATNPMHRHDQAILSLMLHIRYAPLVICDVGIYGGFSSPVQVEAQKIWQHRRQLLESDGKYLARHITEPGPRFQPSEPLGVKGENLRPLRRIVRAVRSRLIGNRVDPEERKRFMEGIR